MAMRHEDRFDHVVDMNVRLALPAVPENIEMARIGKQPLDEVEAHPVRLPRPYYIAEAKRSSLEIEHVAIRADQRLSRQLAGAIGRNRQADSVVLACLGFAQITV